MVRGTFIFQNGGYQFVPDANGKFVAIVVEHVDYHVGLDLCY